MTAFSQISRGEQRTHSNIKEGNRTGRPKSQAAQYEATGFTLIEPPAKWSYTWQGTFPVFTVKPGRINGLVGIVARHDQSNTAEWFPYGTKPEVIKARLDDLILDIMRHDADLEDAPLSDEDQDWIDIDDFMSDGRWVRS